MKLLSRASQFLSLRESTRGSSLVARSAEAGVSVAGKLATVAVIALAASVPARAATAARSLTELQVALYGLGVGVEPSQPIVPKQTASGIRVVVKAGGKTLSAAEVARLLGGPFGVQAELSGPGLGSTLSLPITGAGAIPSADPLILTFPGLPVAGDYELANIRLVRGGQPVLDVQPHVVGYRSRDPGDEPRQERPGARAARPPRRTRRAAAGGQVSRSRA
jgi:hypothetical protein